MIELDYSGLCIIPIETNIKKQGLVSDIIHIPYLDSILHLASRRNLYVLYVSNSLGLVEHDTYVELETKNTNPLFNRIVAEQVYRSCIDMFVCKVYYMGRVKGKLQKDFVKTLRYYGIEVITPLMGYDKKVIPKVLELYR